MVHHQPNVRDDGNKALRQQLIAKADDPENVSKALEHGAAMARNLWLAFLAFGAYLLVAVGSITHRDLFLETPIKLPLLNVELPLVGFVAVAPLLFVTFHANLLLNLKVLGDKVERYAELVGAAELDDERRDQLRLLLPNFISVQLPPSPSQPKLNWTNLLLKLILWATIILAPILFLLLLQVKFLPHHHPLVTWEHRAIVAADLLLLCFVWPYLSLSKDGRKRLRVKQILGLCLCAPIVAFSMLVATFPGERIASLVEGTSLYDWLFDGPTDQINQSTTTLLSNKLVLNDWNGSVSVGGRRIALSLRGRDLRGADLSRTHLENADLSGANLEGAVLVGAHFSGAMLGCANEDRTGVLPPLEHAWPDGCTWLAGANLKNAAFDGAMLNGVRLQGADISGANFSGSDLTGAHLEGVVGVKTVMTAATLNDSHLQAARFEKAHFEATDATGANLTLSTVSESWLQGAVLSKCEFGGTSLSHSKVWALQGLPSAGSQAFVRTLNLDFSKPPFGSQTFKKWQASIMSDIPEGPGRTAADTALAGLDARAHKTNSESDLRAAGFPDLPRIFKEHAQHQICKEDAFVANVVTKALINSKFVTSDLAIGIIRCCPGRIDRAVADRLRGIYAGSAEKAAALEEASYPIPESWR